MAIKRTIVPAADGIASVNGDTGPTVVLDAADVGADPAGTAAAAVASRATTAALTTHTSDTANPHGVTKAQVGLGNVSNLASADLPVSTATQTALDAKLDASNALASGDETILRDLVTVGSSATTAGSLRLSYFTARKSETTTQVKVLSGSTAAAATPTLARIGLYEIDGSGNGTLVAATTSDTALFSAANTAYTKSWASSFAKVKGQRYAVGILFVTGAAAPTIAGAGIVGQVGADVAPRLAAVLTAQTDMPSSFIVGSLAVSVTRFYAAVMP